MSFFGVHMRNKIHPNSLNTSLFLATSYSSFSSLFKGGLKFPCSQLSSQSRTPFSSSSPLSLSPSFGIMFDIDGVIVRGKTVLPSAPEAFKMLVDRKTKDWRIPTIFVTNAGNSLRIDKANQLSNWLNVKVTEEQVVMAHSPLKMFTEYHNKHVLVMGQGPVGQIAHSLGFSKVTTMDQLRHTFPSLDSCDHKRRRAAPCSFNTYFPRIEAVVMFGEPVRWETSLQLLIDVLLTDGHPSVAPTCIPNPHIPILACNMDLQWMAEAIMPRFGHGAFLLCVENLYKKVTGQDLVYTALVGKPSEITYRHGEHVLQGHARQLGKSVSTIYCVGDNVCTDIFGANLYNRYLQVRRQNKAVASNSRCIDRLVGQEVGLSGAEECHSVLVNTGVFSKDDVGCPPTLEHSPRDFLPVENSFKDPFLSTENVLEAVTSILNRENFD